MENQKFTFNCPHCGQPLEAETDWAGMQVECPSCGKAMVIPSFKPSTTPNINDVSKPKLAPDSIMTQPSASNPSPSRKIPKCLYGIAIIAFVGIGVLAFVASSTKRGAMDIDNTKKPITRQFPSGNQPNGLNVDNDRTGSAGQNTEADKLFTEAMRYYNGDDVLQNYDKAMRLLLEASAKGSKDADAQLATIYWNAEANQERNTALAVKYALQHGDNRTSSAWMVLGLAIFWGYKTDEGNVARNLSDAYKCFSKVTDSYQAVFFLGLMQYHGVGTQKSPAAAAETFFECCKNKSSVKSAGDAALCLGYLYYKGEGVSQNYDQAKRWLLWGWKNGHGPSALLHKEERSYEYPGGMDLLIKAASEYYKPLGGYVFQWEQ